MWRLSGDNQLENLAGLWKYSEKELLIPPEESEGFIIEKENGNILAVKQNELSFFAKDDPIPNGEFSAIFKNTIS